ncbi:TetR/AcrR family transcriptional regulator [Planosporangium flavigriseum]|uniref:TetR family transcriptional regulator n=1 Tax=Planosporangium flavigriseum TaxID=373681 RepID=A0A8J3LIK2_9ACTN|nr:TetR/AcrR family transcriptional regulator [Planosporangium flavigriseum]NJC64548.1 TetR/AcrR family transcriptional regulator [Planosporangium flavigriseum]GIG71969.1 TetR family transcriptional regulator [Planosporangium flavigriseum]
MLDAAVSVFGQRGFHAASMDEIAEAAGISKPMVYAYLGSKEDLFTACLHREATRLVERVVEAVGVSARPDEQLWNGLRGFFAFVGSHREGWNMLYRQSRGREPFASEWAAMRGRMVEVVSGLLTRAVESAGGSGTPADLESVTYGLVGAAESMADWLADNPGEDPGRTAARLMNFIWLGAEDLLRGAVWRPAS